MDVHRKNSSESSDSLTEVPSSTNHSNGTPAQIIDRRSVQMKTKSKSEDASTVMATDTMLELRSVDEGDLLSKSEERRDKFVDTDNGGLQRINDSKKRMRNKLQRQTSLDSSGPDLKNFPVRRPVSSNHLHRQHHGSGFYHPNHLASMTPEMYLEPHFTTKSELAIERFVVNKKTPMRKDSTSTMSAIQLPTNSTSSTTRQRRYSNTAAKTQQQLSSGMVSMRRIKSTALEKCCPQPSYSNLSPHPNSVETINGRPLRNPPHAILPPPSKSLVRNQHLNFFPKGTSGSIEPVYPIAEIVDEKSLNEGFILTSESDDENSESNDEDDNENDDDDDDDDNNNSATAADGHKDTHHSTHKGNLSLNKKSKSFNEKMHQKTPVDDTPNVAKKHSIELEIDRSRSHSTDSENEMNNGSQSPLLEPRERTAIFSSNTSKCDNNIKPNDTYDESKIDSIAEDNMDDAEEGAVGGVDPAIVPKSEDSGCPSSDCEQASASSKDMLLSKKSKSSERNWHDFNIDANSISVDLSENTKSAKTTDTTVKNSEQPEQKLAKDTSKSLGAIPKTSFSKYEMNEETTSGMKTHQHDSHDHSCENYTKSLSNASSANSLSGGSCNSSNSLNKNVLQVIQQTEDGWVLQSASPNNPYLVAQRGELLPVYNTRTDNVFPVSRKPYLYLHQQRQYHPKMRSTRNRMQNSSVDTTTSSREEEDSMSMVGAAGGSIGVNSGWDVMGFDMKISERLSTLFFPELTENQTHGTQSTTQRSTINRMTFADSMFWGHCNLPVEKKVQPKRYYKFPIKCLDREIKISMDRLQLLALFDRDCGTFQAVASILIGVCCSILGAVVLQLDFYRDIFAFIFCFVMAGSQYSLLKSVQPDASSSTHGDDARYSRPIYFCLCTSILILSHHFSSFPENETELTLFGIPFTAQGFFYSIQEIMSIILLLFPILFSFGLFAQINTFVMYALEQFDMHLFGGNADCSLISAFLSIFKSIMACCILYGFAFGGLSESRSTQHVLFSCFCALLVATAYHLSRSASDCTYLWAIIKSSFMIHIHDDDEELRRATKLSKSEKNKSNKKKGEFNTTTKISINKEKEQRQTQGNQSGPGNVSFDKGGSRKESNESVNTNSANESEQKAILTTDTEGIIEKEELEDPLPSKLKNTVYARLKNDFLICTVIGAIVMSLHSSTVFTALQPELNPILQSFVIVLGFLIHYLIPQMRKYLPWLCFAKPILKQKEYGMYETSEAAKIMWFEKLFVYLSFVEKNILLPLIFISALTSDSLPIVQKFGIPIGSAIVVVCGLKSKYINIQII